MCKFFRFILYVFVFFSLNICVNLLYSPPSGSRCHAAPAAAAAAAAATPSAACTLPSCPGSPPPKLSATCAHRRPHGQEAGGAGPHGSDAGDLQLHAGDDDSLPKDKLPCVGGSLIGLPCFSRSQDSMLEFDGPPIDPAIISAQPMKPAANMELPQMVCPPGRFPPRRLLREAVGGEGCLANHQNSSQFTLSPGYRNPPLFLSSLSPHKYVLHLTTQSFFFFIGCCPFSPVLSLLSVLSGSYRFPNSAPHVPERSHAGPSTTNRKHRPHPGGPHSSKATRSIPVCFIMLTVNISPLPQTSMSLPSEQPPPSTALPAATQAQVFQPVSKAPHSSGINVNAAPFQSMQTVSPWWKTLNISSSTTGEALLRC